MGKRKKATKPPPKAKMPKVDKIFDCPFCGQEKSVEAAINTRKGIGSVSCRNCGASHRKEIHALEEGIDVFQDWVDAALEANKEERDESD